MLPMTAGTDHNELQPYLIDICLALHHPCEGVVEPVLELCVTGKHLGHQEVHEGPQLHQIVLQRRACRQGAKWYSVSFKLQLQLCRAWMLLQDSKLWAVDDSECGLLAEGSRLLRRAAAWFLPAAAGVCYMGGIGGKPSCGGCQQP